MSHAEPGRPLGELLTGLVGDISGLFRKEIQLAKAEASESIDEAMKASRNLAIGAVLAIGATGVFLAAIVTGLAAVLVNAGMAEQPAGFVAGLAVTVLIGAIAWAFVSRGLAELKANKINMQRTTNSIRMDAATVKESF
jgi:succinate dehydrogenase/fumarate reductase cytochrome b subunit